MLIISSLPWTAPEDYGKNKQRSAQMCECVWLCLERGFVRGHSTFVAERCVFRGTWGDSGTSTPHAGHGFAASDSIAPCQSSNMSHHLRMSYPLLAQSPRPCSMPPTHNQGPYDTSLSVIRHKKPSKLVTKAFMPPPSPQLALLPGLRRGSPWQPEPNQSGAPSHWP
jgi:hypothetical protein